MNISNLKVTRGPKHVEFISSKNPKYTECVLSHKKIRKFNVKKGIKVVAVIVERKTSHFEHTKEVGLLMTQNPNAQEMYEPIQLNCNLSN